MKKLVLDQLNRLSIPAYKAQAKIPLVLLLDNVRSLNNVGSIFRTADAFLIEHLYLCGITGTPPHRDIQKTALGATESVAWSYESDILQVIAQLKASGYAIWGLEQTDQSTHLTDIQLIQQPIALIFGNEVNGIQQEVIAQCDLAVEIAQYGTKHSLNIAVAAGIAIHHLFYCFETPAAITP
jgi:23S rRNA (guanosine2251-2'-O)-methyltransferase